MILDSSVVSNGGRRARQLAAWCLASALVLSVSASRAEPATTDAQRAERLFEEGRTAMEQQSFDFACAAFAESQRLDPAAGTLVNWGVCLEAQGKLLSALAAYRSSLSSAATGSDPDRERFVEDRIAALEPRLCSVTVTLRNPPAGVNVLLDSTVLPADRWNVPVPTDRGSHGIQVSAPGYRTWSKAFTLDSDGAVGVVEVPNLEHESPSSPLPPSQPVRPSQPAPSEDPRRVGLIVAGGVALAGAATAVYFGSRAASAWDERQRHCPAHQCDDTAVAASHRAATFARAADVAVVVTGAALGVGLYVVLSSKRAPSPPHSSLVLRGERESAQVQWSGEF